MFKSINKLSGNCEPFIGYRLVVDYQPQYMNTVIRLHLYLDNSSYISANCIVTDEIFADANYLRPFLYKHFHSVLITNHVHSSELILKVLDQVYKDMYKNVFVPNPLQTGGVFVSGNSYDAAALYESSLPSLSYLKESGSDVEYKANKLPGIYTYVELPCDCDHLKTTKVTVKNAVIHLNDKDHWDRNKVADWLDRLHDDGMIDIEFKTDEPVEDKPFKNKPLEKWKANLF